MSFIVKNTTFPNLLDLLAPHSCRGCGRLGEPLCDCCKNYIIKNHVNLCPNCKNKTKHGKCTHCKNLPPVYSIGPREDVLNSLIHDFKYKSARAIGNKLAELLDATTPDIKNAILVPLPTATNHIRSRGLDHTLFITKRFAHLRHYKVKPLLLRAKNTVQVGADRKTRLLQAKTVYDINKSIPIDHSATYVLLDDVWTTGASMHAALQKLKEAGANDIIIILLAISRI